MFQMLIKFVKQFVLNCKEKNEKKNYIKIEMNLLVDKLKSRQLEILFTYFFFCIDKNDKNEMIK